MLKILALIAFRNLFARPINLVVGLMTLVGTLLLVLGGTLLNSLDGAIGTGLVASGIGHLQLYPADSPEPLDLLTSDPQSLPEIVGFEAMRAELEALPNVSAVVPESTMVVEAPSGNLLDRTLERLRELVEKRGEGAEPTAELQRAKRLMRQMVRLIRADVQNARNVASGAFDADALAALDRAGEDDFWEEMDQDPTRAIEFLERNVAPLLPDDELYELHFWGTDLPGFQRAFPRMKIVSGREVPAGQRGMLLGKLFYEDTFKLKVARRLDQIREAMELRHRKLAEDATLRRMVAQNRAETREILFQLDEVKMEQLRDRLQKALGSDEADPAKLLSSFLDVDDRTFAGRYRLFYEQVAPLVELYRFQIGDELTLRSITRTGYLRSARVKLYGLLEFSGMERSNIGGNINLLDTSTASDLYGRVTAESAEEIRRIMQDSGLKDVSRSDVEADLFGSGMVVETGVSSPIDDAELLKPAGSPQEASPAPGAPAQEPVVLHAAVILKDPRLLEETTREIEQMSARRGHPLRARPWQEVFGAAGQFLVVLRAALYVGALVIFLVVILIINNALIMSTLQRVREIGTLRAIGAQRSFCRAIVASEAMLLCMVFGGLGVVAGAVITWALRDGIPASSDEIYALFAGPRLFLSLSSADMVAAFATVLVLSFVSTLYPAALATRVPPVVAMQAVDD